MDTRQRRRSRRRTGQKWRAIGRKGYHPPKFETFSEMLKAWYPMPDDLSLPFGVNRWSVVRLKDVKPEDV